MRKLVFLFLTSSLLLALASVQKVSILTVNASLDVYQGDIILDGNNVTTIEDTRFDINGSIIVEENATLILNNAMVNFTQAYARQFNMTFRNPVGGNPRFQAENATITSNDYLDVRFYENSSVMLNEFSVSSLIYLDIFGSSVMSLSNSTKMYARISAYDHSNINISNSPVSWVRCYGYSVATISDSKVTGELRVSGSSVVNVSSSDIRPWIDSYSANISITGLEPGFFGYWNYGANCSVYIAPGGWAPNLILKNTDVRGWRFSFSGSSDATVLDSTICDLWAYDHSVVHVYNSTITSELRGYVSPRIYFYNSTTSKVYSGDNSKLWFANSTSNTYDIYAQCEVYVSWYLDVHVVDSIGQHVPSANATATYPNATIAESKLTDVNGLARLTLTEKMKNATGDYPVGNYTVEATYETHSESASVNMTGNQQITLELEDFVIPEYPPSIMMLLLIATTTLAITFATEKTPRKPKT